MTGFDEGLAGDGEPAPRTGPGPFFPGPAGRQGTVPPPGVPLPAPAPAPAPARPSVTTSGANALPMTLHGSPGDISTGVDGRITIEDGVIGKIAALAALEVGGVAALIPDAGAAGTGVHVDFDEAADEVTLDVVIAVEYGTVVRDVAKLVKTNVARVTGLMLGTRVAAVHVTVQDVHVPNGHATGRA
ncbi:hypothetical protein GCM10022254_69310 [Actinomadura meridiana]|uniref:Asp23/Gls24 family envelope stress response protein n=1 Tax=Actinomadura meridiana TaxID=559626 RepID=A0ABP8CN87_9ACTN